MSMTMSSALPENKAAGVALGLGVLLSFLAVLFFPGGSLIDPVDQTDFPAAIGALADNANISHATTLLFILALLLEAYGLLALFRLTAMGGSIANAALRFGLVGVVFSMGLYIVELGTWHMVVHTLTHGLGDSVAQADLEDFAVVIFAMGAAVHFAFLAIASVASIFLGFGLVSRFAELDIYKLASYGMIFVGAAGLLNLIVVQHIHDIDLNLIALISNVLLTIGAICYFIFGVGMYFGRSAFASGEASG